MTYLLSIVWLEGFKRGAAENNLSESCLFFFSKREIDILTKLDIEIYKDFFTLLSFKKHL